MHLEGNLILIDFCRRHYPEFYHFDVSGYVLDFTWFETSVISCQRKRRSSPTIWSSSSKFSWRSLRMGVGVDREVLCACFLFPISPPEDFSLIQIFSDKDFCAFVCQISSVVRFGFVCSLACSSFFTSLQHQRHLPYWTFHPLEVIHHHIVLI